MRDAIEIARKCIAEISDGWGEKEDEKAANEIAGIIAAAIAAEREACAKIVDEFAQQLAMQGHGSTDNLAALVDRIAAAIRARGKT